MPTADGYQQLVLFFYWMTTRRNRVRNDFPVNMVLGMTFKLLAYDNRYHFI